MKHKALVLSMILCSSPLVAADTNQKMLTQEVLKLQQKSQQLQAQLNQLQKQLAESSKPQVVQGAGQSVRHTTMSPATHNTPHQVKKASAEHRPSLKRPAVPSAKPESATTSFHNSTLMVHSMNSHPESMEFYPTALVADNHVISYIAGTPIVTSPYLGSRPAFDGSDYIVNISSINRDIRLMQQRRRLYRAYETIGYPAPNVPIIALSGKVEPIATIGHTYGGTTNYDVNLGSGELDAAAILNRNVEGYIGLAYDSSPPDVGGQRLSNSSVDLNMGFVNIGDLDKTPFYLTAGQLYVPFGRYSTSMVSATLPMILARTKARPFILGYKSQQDSGPFAAVYGYKGDTDLGSAGVGGLNLGYVFDVNSNTGELGASVISSMNDSGGMQYTGSAPNTTFGGFGSASNGNEAVKKIPALGFHAYTNIDRYSLTAEWVGAIDRFRAQDLSFNGQGAKPQAAQIEAGMTFRAFDKPASVAVGYQRTKEALALNLPSQRINGVFNISIWKDTVESLEYRHDMNYKASDYANGAAAIGGSNLNTIGGGSADTLLAQIGVYF